MPPEAALRLKKLEAAVDSGELDILEFYKSASGIFKMEQAAAERAALESAP